MSSASANNSSDNLKLHDGNDSEEDAPKRINRLIRQFSDSDSEEVTQIRSDELDQEEFKLQDSNSNNNAVITIHKKSRIRKSNIKSSSDSEASIQDDKSVSKENPNPVSSSGIDSDEAVFKSIIASKPHEEASIESSDSDTDKYGQHMRIKNKRNKMKDKFKNLLMSRGKEQTSDIQQKEQTIMNSSNSSDDELASIEKIKQKIKEKMAYKPSICDPDTSDEETDSRQKSMPKQKKEKRTKMISPKPQRMSAKQAMENMQKIKSESNRMLREKEVTLPYHRPKALSLKDIMSRRKPAMSSDGKCLPIKMNGDQLKQYAQQLEDRQKQMMELWQSDSDGENDDKQSDDEKPVENAADDKTLEEGTNIDEQNVISVVSVSEDAKEVTKLTEADISAANDELFDVLSQSIIVEKANAPKEKESQLEPINDKVTEEQDSETNFKLVFNESETSVTEDKQDTNIADNSLVVGIEVSSVIETDKNSEQKVSESASLNTESDSQLVSLLYDSEMQDSVKITGVQPEISPTEVVESDKTEDETENIEEIKEMDVDGFSDDDMNIEDIDNIIENAEVIRDFEDKVNSQVLIRDRPLNLNPKLTGSPGMVIDLDDNDTLPKKSGVELLKERFTFFAKLKTPEEMERAKERQIKPGRQHLKLKQELEQQMAEQRSLEWAKRLEDEKLQQKELKELRGDESDDENDIDKIEAKLNNENVESEPDSSESEEELLENDIEMKDKPRTKNPMLENEADESECEENEEAKGKVLENEDGNEESNEVNDGDDEDDAESSDDSESSESEEEQTSTKKGRILKAFEDSDEEDATTEMKTEASRAKSGCEDLLGSQLTSQDDVLTLAQRHKSVSEDLFTSQGSSLLVSQIPKSLEVVPESVENDVDLGTQTFSIMDSIKNTPDFLNPSLGGVDKINDICGKQTYLENLDAAMCSGSFSQDLPPLPISQVSQSQTIGENILALCTGKFYENEFVSQAVENQTPLGASQEFDDSNVSPVPMSQRETQEAPKDIMETEKVSDNEIKINKEHVNKGIELNNTVNKVDQTKIVDDNLKSILDELDDPEFDVPKPNKFFCGATQKQMEKEKKQVIKKKLIIDSDDDNEADASETKKRKKIKKKKPEMRALHISDDEEEDQVSELEEYESEIEEENEERLVEYDSEENEIEIKPHKENPKLSKKKRKGTEFFEQEAELTSEDEWAGSGDEDEAGLDRMEREAGDDESFHQGRLQRELGQIHMREVIDQDRREVRIIQELLFEDGDLGAGGRQRKFKWKNLDGDEETGTGGDEFKDTQEEEFESEEQWRKQRHERESFLRQMQNNGEHDDSLNVSINRTTIIKANLMSKTMSTLLAENQPPSMKEDIPVETDKKTKDIPSPKKPFSILQQSYQGSILNRGRGALARLAALATPLATDDDAPKGKSVVTSSARNFVFATLTPEAPKVTKRKADANPGTPALVKKMKTEEQQNMTRSRLFEHMKV